MHLSSSDVCFQPKSHKKITNKKDAGFFFHFSTTTTIFRLLIKSNALIGERAVDHFSKETDSCLAASVNFGQGKDP